MAQFWRSTWKWKNIFKLSGRTRVRGQMLSECVSVSFLHDQTSLCILWVVALTIHYYKYFQSKDLISTFRWSWGNEAEQDYELLLNVPYNTKSNIISYGNHVRCFLQRGKSLFCHSWFKETFSGFASCIAGFRGFGWNAGCTELGRHGWHPAGESKWCMWSP